MPDKVQELPAFGGGDRGLAAALMATNFPNLPLELFLKWGPSCAAPVPPVLEPFARQLQAPETLAMLAETAARFKAGGIGAVSIFDPRYPELLREIFSPPLYLTYLGDLSACKDKPAIAIVGSRKADLSGCTLARDMARELALRGALIVSGLALGIDGAAHRGALDSGVRGATAAVLGNGLPDIYPRRHERLAAEIVQQGGAILSQFPADQPAYPANFLNRNRIIAGLCDLVIVIQAAERSGSLVTARMALDEGRDVAAVPGDIRHPLYSGANYLIKKGAYLINCVEDVIDIIGSAKFETLRPAYVQEQSYTPLEKQILERLKAASELRQDALLDLASFGELATVLLNLELSGAVRRLPGNALQLTCKR